MGGTFLDIPLIKGSELDLKTKGLTDKGCSEWSSVLLFNRKMLIIHSILDSLLSVFQDGSLLSCSDTAKKTGTKRAPSLHCSLDRLQQTRKQETDCKDTDM